MSADAPQPSPDNLDQIVENRATCPFVGSAVAMQKLPVHFEVASSSPLASITDLERLGNTGGGDLGEVLVFFATGNHDLMRGPDGTLTQPVPGGLFSLEFPGSKGSHPGHSRILEDNPTILGSGRLSRQEFDRLASRAVNGLIKRSDVGGFIAENLHRDRDATVFGPRALEFFLHDSITVLKNVGHQVVEATLQLHDRLHGTDENTSHEELVKSLTALARHDNLFGSCGEWGLLFAFLAKSPRTQVLEGAPALSLTDIESMFIGKRLPKEWEMWPKTRADWLTNTTALIVSAGKAYLQTDKTPSTPKP